MSPKPPYLGAIGQAMGQGVVTAAWIASGELSPTRRRAVRIATTTAAVATGWLASARDQREITYTAGDGLVIRHPDGTEEHRPVRIRSVAATAASAAFGLGLLVGRRQLEKRWLARLRQTGHEHPHRALALRMGLLAIAGALGGRLVAAHEARTKAD